MSFEAITTDIGMTSMNRLINKLFVNDVALLQKGGRLFQITLTCAARLIGSYNKLCTDLKSAAQEKPPYGVGPDNNPIMIAIQDAAARANIDDPTIPQILNVPCWLTVLRTWSNRITDHFKTSNPDRISQNASLTQQVVGMQNQLLDNLGSFKGLSEKIDGSTEDRTMIDVLQHTINHQASRIAALETAITCLRNKNQRQKRSLEMLYEQSPPPKRQRNNDDGDCSLLPDSPTLSWPISAEEEAESARKSDYADASAPSPSASDPPAQSTVTAATETTVSMAEAAVIVPTIPPLLSLNGVQQTVLNPSGVTITSALEVVIWLIWGIKVVFST
jgi:hypothetical protein